MPEKVEKVEKIMYQTGYLPVGNLMDGLVNEIKYVISAQLI
jgi:hypothetical protein